MVLNYNTFFKKTVFFALQIRLRRLCLLGPGVGGLSHVGCPGEKSLCGRERVINQFSLLGQARKTLNNSTYVFDFFLFSLFPYEVHFFLEDTVSTVSMFQLS